MPCFSASVLQSDSSIGLQRTLLLASLRVSVPRRKTRRMPAPLKINPATSSSKRSRSSDSQRSSSATPGPTPSKCAGDPSDLSLPAFLRQSNAGMFFGCMGDYASCRILRLTCHRNLSEVRRPELATESSYPSGATSIFRMGAQYHEGIEIEKSLRRCLALGEFKNPSEGARRQL